MGFWPFGGGKRQRAAEPTKDPRKRSLQSDPSEKADRLETTVPDLSGHTKSSTQYNQEQGDETPRLSKMRMSGSQQQLHPSTDPTRRSSTRRYSQPVPLFSEKPVYQHDTASKSSLGPENFNVARQSPRLVARRSDNEKAITRRKSSKRKAEDYAREREVRAMSSSPIPIPKRPTSFYGSGLLQRETRDVPTAFGRKSSRPASQVSLPMPEVLADVDDTPYQNSFKISMFAALSPRPTVKYDANPKHLRGKQPHRPDILSRPTIVEEDSDADKKRIDDLADDLDAGALRELMERDRRRKERKKQVDQARLQRKLERRADRQREEEARKARTEEYVSASASRAQGYGLESSTSKTPTAPLSESQRSKLDPFADPKSLPTSPVVIRNPFDDEKDLEALHDLPSDNEPEVVVPVKSPLRKIHTEIVKVDNHPAHGTLSPPTSPAPRAVDRQSMSQASLLYREVTADIPENASLTGAASDHSSQHLSSWTAFFRRGTRRKLSSSFQGRSTPSEFSNTSRESFARKQPPPIIPQRTFRRADATPQRTMSKFREDLPEFPISPPDSRMQSPEATVLPGPITFNQAVTEEKVTAGRVDENLSSVTSQPVPIDIARREGQSITELDGPTGMRPELLLSQSLASIGSEASWLSGKPINRRSGVPQPPQPSRSSLTKTMPGAFDGGVDVVSPPESPMPTNASQTVDDTVQKDETWHSGLGRQPTVIKQVSRAKSKEGLLNEYTTQPGKETASDSDNEDDDDDSHDSEDEVPAPAVALGRARSVEYKGHARHISGGSARLLDIRRSSTHSQDLLARQASTASRDVFTENQT